MALLNISNCNGDYECHSLTELENFIRKSSLKQFDDIWLSGNTEYPCLAILVKGSYACVHYFLNDEGDMWQSVGYGDLDITFILSNGDESDKPADCVISINEAIQCARQFYGKLDKPDCIEWREL